MEMFTKDNGRMTKLMERVFITTTTARATMASGTKMFKKGSV